MITFSMELRIRKKNSYYVTTVVDLICITVVEFFLTKISIPTANFILSDKENLLNVKLSYGADLAAGNRQQPHIARHSFCTTQHNLLPHLNTRLRKISPSIHSMFSSSHRNLPK